MSLKNKMGRTPAEIVAELDRFIVGQKAAKKAYQEGQRRTQKAHEPILLLLSS